MPAAEGSGGLDRDSYEAVVVGSGFGGAVAACRLAQAGVDVAVVERGRRYPPGSFPRDLGHPHDGWLWSYGKGLYDVDWSGEMITVAAAGYGGGSLVYANVAMRAPDEAFQRWWPEPYRRATLDRYYDLAAHMLDIKPVQPDPRTGLLPQKTRVMQEVGRRFGNPDSVFLPNIAVSFDQRGAEPMTSNRFGVPQSGCIGCGECDIGCNVGAKNTLDLTYLAVAERAGAQVATLTEVTALGRGVHGYRVHLVDHAGGGARREITAEHVFVCAGAIGSTELLLRSRDQYRSLPDLPTTLGDGYSGNGDFLAFGYDTADVVRPGEGPTITSACVLRGSVDGEEQWFVAEDGGYSPHLAGLVRHLDASRLVPLRHRHLRDGAARTDDGSKGTGADADDHTVVLLVMGRDRADGVVRLRGPGHRLTVHWDTAGNLPLYAAEEAACAEVVATMGGRLRTIPTWKFLRTPVSVHNLGGCHMSTSPAAGVVDLDGQVHGHPGLYVLDGAILPSATGVNPSHTITAVAERCIEIAVRRITGVADWTAPEVRDAGPVDCPEDRIVAVATSRPAPPPTSGIRFSESMRGTAPVLTGEDGHATPRPTVARLIVTVPDLAAFLTDPQHAATVSGRVAVAGLTSRAGADVTGGVLHLLARTGDGRCLTMAYVLPFTGSDGLRWVLHGAKDVRHRRGVDVWRATTTLFAAVSPEQDRGRTQARMAKPGGDPAGGTGGSAARTSTASLRLRPIDFAREIVSLRATGSARGPGGVRTLWRFLWFFAAELLDVFTPVPRNRRSGVP